MNEYIKSDLYRYYGHVGYLCFLKAYIVNSGFRYMVAHRLVNHSKGIGKMIGEVLWKFRSRAKLDIGKKADIGFGLYIGHGGPCIISEKCTIKNNVNISQFLSIGSNDGEAATIGNGVYIGPNVSIVENISVGDEVTIGAGSVVTKNIPGGATAVGNYAKVINYDRPGRYIYNRYPTSGQ